MAGYCFIACLVSLYERLAGRYVRKKRTGIQNSVQRQYPVNGVGAESRYSVENAIREAAKDIAPVYGKDTRIIKEYTRMIHKMDLNMPVSSVLEEFALRTGQEDVENFVNVFTAAKISGGDSISVIRNAVKIISEKIDTEKEIHTMLASKKLEFEIMCAVPFVIILYMKMTFGDFLEVLYGNTAGMIVMSICLAVYIAAYRLGRYIIRIEV